PDARHGGQPLSDQLAVCQTAMGSKPKVRRTSGVADRIAGGSDSGAMRVVDPHLANAVWSWAALAPARLVGELIDVAVWCTEMAPSLAAIVDVPAEQLHASLLQLRHGSGEVLDHKADHRAAREVQVVLIAGAEHLEGVARGQVQDREVWRFARQGQPEDGCKELHHGAVVAGPGACPTDPCD